MNLGTNATLFFSYMHFRGTLDWSRQVWFLKDNLKSSDSSHFSLNIDNWIKSGKLDVA